MGVTARDFENDKAEKAETRLSLNYGFNMASPHPLALTKKVYSILEISDSQQKQQAKRSDTETRAMENQFACYIATQLAVKFIYCETRLGAIYASIKGDRREILHSVIERLGFLKAQGQNPSEVDLSNAMLQHGISCLILPRKPHDQLDSLEVIVKMAHDLIDMRTIHDEPYSSGNSYSFGNHLIQKFSAAVYLSREPLMTLIEFIKQNIISQNNKLTTIGEDEHEEKVGKDCSEVLTYVFGLAKSGLNDSLSDALPSIIQFMFQTIVTTEPIVDDRIALVILACLRQAQDFTLCRKVHHEHFKRQIFSYKFHFLELTDLGYYLSCTSSEQQLWTIYYNDKVTGNAVSAFVSSIYKQYKITVHCKAQPDITMKEQGRIVISNRNLDHLKSVLLSSVASVYSDMSMVLGMEAMQEGMSPTPRLPSDPSSTLSSSASPLPYKFGYISKEKYEAMQTAENVTYFNMVKDVVVTSLQPYSKLPLECQYRKADHIWITGSQSLRYHFYKSVLIAPYVPMHWVKVKQPDGSRDLETKYEGRANAEMRSDTVSPDTSEIVLLNSHRYTQIAITTLTGDQSVISLYNNSEEAEAPGFIGCDYLAPSHELKGKVLWKELKPFDIVKDERVGRELPLPSKRGTESGDMTATTASKALDDDPDRFKPSTRPTSSVYDTTKSTAGGIRPLGVTTANEQQIKRQALEAFDTAGQCFYGDNIKFFSGKVYTQPNALPGARVLREGGNGLILEIYYEGTPYAVKRTAFRWREILIMPKLHHENILQLTAMLMGPPIEGYPRRRYVYHYYPRMTNDLGRLIGSYEKYCLRTLKDKFKNEKLLLNKILSNFRFVARELLKGLNYLHTLPNPIVHRDIKPSNILVLTECDCPNPLACVCRKRPRIVLSDFDASLELASDGSLHPDPPRSLMTQGFYISSERTYHISPVGTIGFKSPEGFIHMIGNSADVMPVLTTKADIFSFGLVMLLIVLAEEGPRSMSKMGVLLLSLNTSKMKVDRTPKSSISTVAVTDKDINKILPFHRLKSEFAASLPAVVDFITTSLEIDPDNRPTAKDLLSHPFLEETGKY